MIPDTLHIPIPGVGALPLHLFGMCLALGFLAAGSVTGRGLAARGYDREIAGSMVFWAAVGGLVGARLWVVLEDWPGFVRDPAAFLLTGGGFVFYGGLFGGAAAVSVLLHRHGVPWLAGADAAAPGIVIGQAIGRWGCQLSGDGDWGTVTTLPWGMRYPYAVACDVPCDCATGQCVWPPDVYVHPAPLYESAAYFLIFWGLWRLAARKPPPGTIIAAYLLCASAARFVVEFVRINPRVAFGLSEAQLTSIVLVAASLGLLAGRKAWRTGVA